MLRLVINLVNVIVALFVAGFMLLPIIVSFIYGNFWYLALYAFWFIPSFFVVLAAAAIISGINDDL